MPESVPNTVPSTCNDTSHLSIGATKYVLTVLIKMIFKSFGELTVITRATKISSQQKELMSTIEFSFENEG